MQELSDRDRSIAAYAAVVRGFHTFFGAVILILALLHLFVLLPFIEARTAAPALRAAIERTRQDAVANADADRALAASSAALVAFKKALDAAPVQLSAQIGSLVARSQNGGRPFDYAKAVVRVPREAGTPLPSPPTAPAAGPVSAAPATQPAGEEVIAFVDAVRRAIGKQTEALSVALDGALAPLRSLKSPPHDVAAAVRVAEEGLGRNVLALNDVLREAFDAEPGFWQRLGAAGATFAAASPRGSTWHAGMTESVRALEERLASAVSLTKTLTQTLTQRVQVLDGQQAQAGERLAAFTTRMAWLPVGLELWTRLYPIVAGALALTVLVRLQRVMLLRQSLGDRHLDELAPSWIIGPPGAPGRWWALMLVFAPLLLSAHAAVAALRDPDLFVTPLGDRNVVSMILYGVVYAGIILAGVLQLRAMLRGAGRAGRPAGAGTRVDPA